MPLPHGKEPLYRYVPTTDERQVNPFLADEYRVYEHPEMSCGIEAYERHGEDWVNACALRPVLASALRWIKAVGQKRNKGD